MQNNRREIQPPQDKEDEDFSKEEESTETGKDTSVVDGEGDGTEEELKDRTDAQEGKEEMVIGDDGNWKRAKKRDDEDEEGKKL